MFVSGLDAVDLKKVLDDTTSGPFPKWRWEGEVFSRDGRIQFSPVIQGATVPFVPYADYMKLARALGSAGVEVDIWNVVAGSIQKPSRTVSFLTHWPVERSSNGELRVMPLLSIAQHERGWFLQNAKALQVAANLHAVEDRADSARRPASVGAGRNDRPEMRLES